MKIAILCNTQDEASINIHNHLQKMVKPEIGSHQVSLHLIETESIYMENIDEELGIDFAIFATKHVSKSGVHSLSVHTQGNWGGADYGGSPKTLAMSPAAWLKEGLKILVRKAENMHYEAIQECTHHGPDMSCPSMFIEIGSALEEWQNESAGQAIAETIIELLKMKIPKYQTAIGIGGLHHTPSFAKVQLNSNVAVGHVCPKYNLQNLTKEMIIQAIEKTSPKAELVILDWKGLGQEKERIVTLLDEMKIEYKKTKSF